MNSKIQTRLVSLKEELKKGQQMLADIEREADDMRATLLRIGGAIQVLEELEQESDENAPE
jgi:hypothetical protein